MTDVDCHSFVLEDYQKFANWYNRIMSKHSPYQSLMLNTKRGIINYYIQEYEKLNKDKISKYNSKPRTVMGLAWRDGWFAQVDKRLSEKSEEVQLDMIEWLAQFKKNPEKLNEKSFSSFIANMIFNHIPDEINQKLNSFLLTNGTK